jgi:uncharacterized protein (TIGR00299 family) protein
MKTAYLNLIGGASGDMLLAALLDAGLSLDALKEELGKLGVDGYTLTPTSPVTRAGVHATHLRVELKEPGRKYTWREFQRVLIDSKLDGNTKMRAMKVFENLAEAERGAHKEATPNLDAELCELGSLDTLVDVVGVVAGLRRLGVEAVACSAVPSGAGVIRSDHGPLPALAPATAQLIAKAKAPVTAPGDVRGEMVTPTGAALITTLAEFRRPTMRLERIGYGAGTKDTPDNPNVVALWIGEEETAVPRSPLTLLETNIDDMNPQLFGYVQERLLGIGVLDVWYTPIQMKKNRPGTLLSVLLPASLEAKVVEVLFTETSTLGVRTRPVERHEAPRSTVVFNSSYGPVSVKVKGWAGKAIAAVPEYEECRVIARKKNLPLQEVLATVTREAAAQFLGEE